MQLVLSNNRIIAHGENFLAMGGVVINTVTGAKYENSTIAECNGCPSDIDEVGYEYHAGAFVPCAPFGKGDNNGCFMEVCTTCATPRSSGIPIKGGLGLENLNLSQVTAKTLGGALFPLIWENALPSSSFVDQTLSLDLIGYVGIAVVLAYSATDLTTTRGVILNSSIGNDTLTIKFGTTYPFRAIQITEGGVEFGSSYSRSGNIDERCVVPLKIYGVKL